MSMWSCLSSVTNDCNKYRMMQLSFPLWSIYCIYAEKCGCNKQLLITLNLIFLKIFILYDFVYYLSFPYWAIQHNAKLE